MEHTHQSWYAVYCQPFKERQTAMALEKRLGLTTYLPEVRRRHYGCIRLVPLFPRYIFVRANLLAISPYRINTTPGVFRLVGFDSIAQPIPAAIIEALRQQVDDLNLQGGLTGHAFQPGDAVRLRKGPFQGLEAVFVGAMRPGDRVRILLDFLGNLRQTEVDVTLLERANAAPPQRERRTRGKGRPIRSG